jgi:AAA domain
VGAIVGEDFGKRRSPSADYLHFHSRRGNRCSRCGLWIPAGTPVLGRPLPDGSWDVVHVACGSAATSDVASGSEDGAGAERPDWPTLVRYLRSCVLREALVRPVPLDDRGRWAALPLPSESVVSGGDLALPLLDQLGALFDDCKEPEAVFYGWPAVVVEDERHQRLVSSLFLRELDRPVAGGDDGRSLVPVGAAAPQVNMGLLRVDWFSPELVAAAAVLADEPVGFGRGEELKALAGRLAAALGLEAQPLEPAALAAPETLDDLSRPPAAGVFNLVIAFKGELDAATRHLIGDLEQMEEATDWCDSAARFLLEPAPPPVPALPESCAVELNDAQEAALAAAAREPLTVVTAPPGTGTGRMVAAMVADAWLRGETVLVSSASDGAIDRLIEQRTGPLDEGLLLRTGQAGRRRELGALLPALVERISGRPPEPEPEASPHAATLARHQATQRLEELAGLQQAVLEAAGERDRARAPLWGAEPPQGIDLPAVEALADRASRTRPAWLRRRRTLVCLERAGVADPHVSAEQVRDWARAESAFQSAWDRLEGFQKANPGDLLAGFGAAQAEWVSAWRAATRTRVRERFVAGAAVLRELAEVLAAEPPPRREAIARAMGHVSGWATDALRVRPSFECRAATIDLVVIGEAGRLGLAAALPLAYRARRLVVVGDPRQPRPVVAGGEQLRALTAEAGGSHQALAAAHLTHGGDSAYSAFAAASAPPHLLEEHDRCHPEIIGFCNRQFYGDRLVVLSRVEPDWGQPWGLEWLDVEGRTERGPSGGALNRAEAAAVAAWVAGSGLEPGRIAVVTPFREQARLIRRLLSDERFGASFQGVRVGTAHTFQGGESETVLFSTVLAAEADPATVAWLDAERDLINLAVSRARRRLLVFGDRVQLRRLGASTLLALAEAADRRVRRREPAPSEVTVALHAALVARGIPASLGSVDEGYPLAITLIGADGHRIDVEVDEFPEGDPRGRARRQAAVRDANLAELGWTVIRIPAWRAALEPRGVADAVLAAAIGKR